MHCHIFDWIIWVISHHFTRYRKNVKKCSKCMNLPNFHKETLNRIPLADCTLVLPNVSPSQKQSHIYPLTRPFFHNLTLSWGTGNTLPILVAENCCYLVSHEMLALGCFYSNGSDLCLKMKKTACISG